MRNRRLDGLKGESVAISYLKDLGYKILDKNVYVCGGEIDIIALDYDTLVFVEVKMRESGKYGMPLESVDYRKKQNLLKSIKGYINQNALYNKNMRIDVIGIMDNDIEHIKDALWLN